MCESHARFGLKSQPSAPGGAYIGKVWGRGGEEEGDGGKLSNSPELIMHGDPQGAEHAHGRIIYRRSRTCAPKLLRLTPNATGYAD
jgi:hypothetical protein